MIDYKREVGQDRGVVLDLVHPIIQSEHNITADNFFVLWIGRRIAKELLRMLEHFIRIVATYLQICYQIGNALYIHHCLVSTTSVLSCPLFQK